VAITVDCLRCQTPMEPGYVLDRVAGASTVEKWSPGEGKLHWWSVASKPSIPVVTMRCPRCGMLKSYAPLA
jgi:hypothetical protein